jgi:putative nucleotidyltransferase with HDIG domain
MLGAVHRHLGELEARRLAQRVPPLPASLDAILREVQSPDASAHVVGRLVAADPVLSGRVLRMVRSGFYSRGRPVVRAEEAVARLGLRTTRNIALAASVRQLAPPPGLGYDQQGFFLHSFATASVATALARSHGEDPDLLFLAGLMHDVGLLIEVAGYDHALVGAIVARHWKLPEALSSIIAAHHAEDATGAAALVQAADRAVDAAGVGLAVCIPCAVDDALFEEAQTHVQDASARAMEALDALR